MNHGYTRIIQIAFLVFSLSFLFSCSPQSRFLRLVKNHPYLLDSFRKDTIYVEGGGSVDTQFIWKKIKDTIIYDNVRIERFRDTIRLKVTEKPCTTYVSKTEIRPSKIVEKYIQEKEAHKTRFQRTILQIKDWSWIIILILLLFVLLRK